MYFQKTHEYPWIIQNLISPSTLTFWRFTWKATTSSEPNRSRWTREKKMFKSRFLCFLFYNNVYTLESHGYVKPHGAYALHIIRHISAHVLCMLGWCGFYILLLCSLSSQYISCIYVFFRTKIITQNVNNASNLIIQRNLSIKYNRKVKHSHSLSCARSLNAGKKRWFATMMGHGDLTQNAILFFTHHARALLMRL